MRGGQARACTRLAGETRAGKHALVRWVDLHAHGEDIREREIGRERGGRERGEGEGEGEGERERERDREEGGEREKEVDSHTEAVDPPSPFIKV